MVEQEKLLNEIQAAFTQLQTAVNQASFEKDHGLHAVQLWQRFQKILQRKDDIYLPKYQKKLNDILKECAEMQDKLEKVQLACYFNQGKEILKNMRVCFAQAKYEQVLRHWKELGELAQEMSKSGQENFRKTAEVLLENGSRLKRESIAHLQIQPITQKIKGIVLSPQIKKICIEKYWHNEGDFITDASGKISRVQIKSIAPGRVTFSCSGVEVDYFWRKE
jgi:hypothetical protein